MEKRASNFSTQEEELLINLIKKYKTEIECKKSDTDTNKIKAVAWDKIYNEFNCILGDHYRTVKVLKNKYENIKKRSKQKYADSKRYVRGTGGGPYKDIAVTKTESDLHDILGSQLTGFTSKFDSDATEESIIIEVDTVQSDKSGLDIVDELIETPTKKIRSAMLFSPSAPDSDFSQKDTPSTSQNNRAESSTTNWSTYTPAILKKPLSLPLQKSENKDATVMKKRSSAQRLSAKLEDWAKNKVNYGVVQERAFIEKHELTMKHMEEKHELEMEIQKKESQARLRFLEAEHKLKMKLVGKKYNVNN